MARKFAKLVFLALFTTGFTSALYSQDLGQNNWSGLLKPLQGLCFPVQTFLFKGPQKE